jgi:hypothetical protein
VLGFKSQIVPDGKQTTATFKTEAGETAKTDVTAVFADKDNLKGKQVNDV